MQKIEEFLESKDIRATALDFFERKTEQRKY